MNGKQDDDDDDESVIGKAHESGLTRFRSYAGRQIKAEEEEKDGQVERFRRVIRK